MGLVMPADKCPQCGKPTRPPSDYGLPDTLFGKPLVMGCDECERGLDGAVRLHRGDEPPVVVEGESCPS